MFGKKIEDADAQQKESGHQRIPVAPVSKKRCPVPAILPLFHICRSFSRLDSYLLRLLEIREATSSPIPSPINNPIVTRLITSPKIKPATIATAMATSR